MSKKMWMIRAGRNAALVQDFEEKNYVAVGWCDLNDLSEVKSKEDLELLFRKAYPGDSPAKFRMSFGQIARFRFEIQKGDYAITYNPEYRHYPIGKIISDYEYVPDSAGDFNHLYKVAWQGKIPRDKLTVATKNTVGAIMTLFLLNDSARDEFLQLLSGGEPIAESDETSSSSEMDDIKRDVIERAFEFIKDRIQKLDWDEMQELMAGILRAMGYKTRVASAGPDRGADVIASPDGLGLEQPRIRVEVKHRSETIGAPTLRSFIGGLRSNDRGLYVSTGGFTREARYEAERSTIPVTLIDIDELADLLIRNYDNSDTETKALIPLIKLYWPA
ncbi:restriction endonuclease [uncultured Desulfosarcina sp.]|uniref:restriction endonuclease n=1 Tax=uncultured Desulfosarcina sp. TaxID=218289 RepID=UPI0029C63C9A|nr:restriction endonuclease [uncultured Desulfosarcina sp.]